MIEYTTSIIVFPKHSNHLYPLIFGGALMEMMDLTAAMTSRRALQLTELEHSVTHKADYTFHRPSYVGDVLDLTGTVKSCSVKSLAIEVIVKRKSELIATGSFVFISIEPSDLSLKPAFLPYVKHGLTKEILEEKHAQSST